MTALPAEECWPRRIAVLCEVLHAPYDEGVRIYAASLATAMGKRREMLLLSERNSTLGERTVEGLLTDRWFRSRALANRLKEFAPEAIVYVPWTSLTPRTFARVGALRGAAPGARVVVVALQPRPVGWGARASLLLGRPDCVVTAGPQAAEQARALGLVAVEAGAGVDQDRFSPASAEERARLRARAGLSPEAFVALHVGHLKESRNVAMLEQVAALNGVRCLLVASSSTGRDKEAAARLAAAGVLVMTHHDDRIESVYRLADVYLFPVVSPLDAIEAPLSVMEAAATDLPIVATRFGALPAMFSDSEGAKVTFVDDPRSIPGAVATLASQGDRGSGRGGTRRLVEGRTWKSVADVVLKALSREAL